LRLTVIPLHCGAVVWGFNNIAFLYDLTQDCGLPLDLTPLSVTVLTVLYCCNLLYFIFKEVNIFVHIPIVGDCKYSHLL
jgi:hypothetical protein